MLELRPTCEHCNKDLPPESSDAMICSFECTFCHSCVELLHNVCPNCGGGFTPRPVRPAHDWHGPYLGKYPATRKVTHQPVDLVAHAQLVAEVEDIPPERR
ncbi:DUF1272 domain-containing protein [Dyella sp. GSA-30]|uniref:DUF1272 domain-containing protein n=1 Tax=Dyella sp. GSA-30 TaxID=2994496 RepID=UPI002492B1F3|nr:DUF1272 domain-containing protein [Dyella sp. GSA-30]BDU19233.1 urease [Dyella sp. GSA-30]